jgi:hypothetical protein
MSEVLKLTQEIKEGLTQTSSSVKDEQRFMRTMLNDREFVVDQYSKGEVVGQICPAQEARDMLTSVIASATKIPQAEAAQLAEAHEFKNAEATNMINVSKSFINLYLNTGRKLPLGGTMDVALSQKHIEETQRPYPKRVGVDDQGNSIYTTGLAPVPAHDTIKVHNPKF